MDWLKNLSEKWNIDKLVAPVANAKKYYQMLDNLLSLVNDSKVSTSVKEMAKGLSILLKSQPNIVSINHFINHWLLRIDPEDQPIVIKELLEVFHERWKNVDRKTADMLYNVSAPNEKKVLIHGSDKAIESYIEQIAVEQQKIDIFHTIGKPAIDSRQQMERLLKNNFNMSAFLTEQSGQYLSAVDFLVIPSSILMHDVFIAPVGAYLLCATMKALGKPTFIVADSRKILNKKYFPKSILDTLISESKKPHSEVWKNAPTEITLSNTYLETVPYHLIDSIVLENEVVQGEYFNEKVDKVLISKFF
ncbi:MAG: hypothetical protein K1X55_11305 [Chitinophagales bacterium]|nr:hypothetical protein [Chitinophagales bacterium]